MNIFVRRVNSRDEKFQQKIQPYLYCLSLRYCKQISYSKLMQKWQQKQRQKVHQHLIENAKPSILRFSKSKERGNTTSKTKKTANIKQHIVPLNKMLQIFQLEQYSTLLASYGFPHQFTKKNLLYYSDQMIEKVKQQDRERFLSFLHEVTTMSKTMQKQKVCHQVTSKSVSKSRKFYYALPPLTAYQSKREQCSTQKSQKSQKTTIKFRTKQKNSITSLMNSRKNANKLSRKKTTEDIIRHQNGIKQQNQISMIPRMKKCISYFQTRATDDLSLIHDFIFGSNEMGVLRPAKQSNKIIQRLMEKLQLWNSDFKKSDQINREMKLQMEKIKQMYLSFDSAMLTSNIINIDLHQMIDCYAMQVKNLIIQAEINNLAKCHSDKIKSLLQQSFILFKEQLNKNKSTEQNQCTIQQKSKQQSTVKLQYSQKVDEIEPSCKISLQQIDSIQIHQEQNNYYTMIPTFDIKHQISQIDEQNIQDQFGTDQSSIQSDYQNCSIELSNNNNMKQSSIWGNSYIASVINDFSCFDYTLEPDLPKSETQFEDIKNFIQLVVMNGKMQKQVTIIAYIYLNKLLNVSTIKQAKVTPRNWKNLVLITLIEASKIWDDQCFENNSFARLIKPYTTLEINRLQKYLVYFLDYRLTIDQKQYSQAYFKLRRHIGDKKCTQTANMMRLDIKTIQKLQHSGINDIDTNQKMKNMNKRQFYKKLMNKSF